MHKSKNSDKAILLTHINAVNIKIILKVKANSNILKFITLLADKALLKRF